MNPYEPEADATYFNTTINQQATDTIEPHCVIHAAKTQQLEDLNELLYALHEEHHLKLPCTFKNGEAALKEKDIAYYLTQPNHFVYVAIHSKQIVGFTTGRVYTIQSSALQPNCVGNIDELYILPEFRRLGIAQTLVSRLEASFIQQGATHAYLDVWSQNTSALSFYKEKAFTLYTYCLKKVLADQP